MIAAVVSPDLAGVPAPGLRRAVAHTRVLAVVRDTAGNLRALDLTQDGIGEKVAAATNKDLMESLFASEGMAY